MLRRLVVAQIGLDGACPVDLVQLARPIAATGTVKAARRRLAQRIWSREPREPESNIMNTVLKPFCDSRMRFTIASATRA